jgi:hypothetical protein
MGEVSGKRRARLSGDLGQRVHCPVAARLLVNRAERTTDGGVAQTAEPTADRALDAWRWRKQAHGFDEQHLRKPCGERVGPITLTACFFDQLPEVKGIARVLAQLLGRRVNHARENAEQRMVRRFELERGG